MVKNEQDIIEPFLRHNSRFFDAMIVIDNGSGDRTRDIALAVSREVPGIFVTDFRTRAHDQAILLSRAMAFVQSAFFADFIFLLDADEFLLADSADALFDRIKAVPVGRALKMPWRTYMPDPAQAGAGPQDVLKVVTWRRTSDLGGSSKVALRHGGGINAGITLGQGSHRAFRADGRSMATTGFPGLEIAHLPIRSESQMLAKGVIGWRANQERADRRPGQAFQWRRLHDLYFQADRAAGDLDIAQEALRYGLREPKGTWAANAVRDPPPILGERRYSDGVPAATADLIAASEAQPPMLPSRFTFAGLRAAGSGPDAIGSAGEARGAGDPGHPAAPLYLDIAPFANLYERLQPASVLEVGCGPGPCLDLARQCGAAALFGVDATDRPGTLPQDCGFLRHDLHEPLRLGQVFDLVQCIETAGRLRPEATGTLLDSLAAHARKTIVFSMAEPGQTGQGLRNPRAMADVLELWAARGWWPDLGATLGFRSLSTLTWLRRNALVLRPGKHPSAQADTAALTTIGGWPFRWNHPAPAWHVAAFETDYPRKKWGYGRRPGADSAASAPGPDPDPPAGH